MSILCFEKKQTLLCMSPHEQSEKDIASHTHASETGHSKAKSTTKQHQVASASTTKKTSKNASKDQPKNKRKASSTQESAPPTKKKTSKGKSKTSKHSTQITESSKTSDQDSTSTEKACRPFWTLSSTDLSKKLWLPTKTDCVDSASNSSKPFASALKCDSWFTIEKRQEEIKNFPRIFWPSSTSSSPETMDVEQDAIGNVDVRMKTQTFRLTPTKTQRKTLAQWFGVYRWTYNQCVSAYYSGLFKPYGTNKRGQQGTLRSMFVNKSSPLLKDKDWVLKVPYDVRDEALREFLNNLNTELGKEHKFRLSYKSRGDRSASIQLLKKKWKKGYYFKDDLKGRLSTTEGPILELEKDSKLVKTKYNTYSLCVVYECDNLTSLDLPSNSVALDPGVRTFMTGYSPSGEVIEIAKGDSNTLFKMCRGVDKVMSRVSTSTNHKSRYQRRRAAARMRDQIRNRIKDLHRKTAKYLCETYKTIFLPVFGTSNMIRKRNRKIRSKTVRQMLTFSHYQFRQHLLHKAKDYSGCRIVLVNEAYTSKTCSCCGNIKQNLGGSKVYKCHQCGLEIDRDINGARNIWIRSVEEVAGPNGAVTLWGLPPVGIQVEHT